MGPTTSRRLRASWMNGQGLRTNNRHRMGKEEAEARFFTNASIRGILHNAFYTGRVKHKDELLDGAHEPLISWEVFEQVQANLARNSGRSRTLAPKPAREYLLKGLVRCAHCGMPMWAQTYKSGLAYYREHRGSRGEGACVNAGGSIHSRTVDSQVGDIIGTMALPEDWLERALERISLHDEVARVRAERDQMQTKLRKLGKAYADDLISDEDYERYKAQYEFDLASLVVPEADAMVEAGRLEQRLPELWAAADLSERRRLLLTLLDAVYVDIHDAKAVVSIRPKAAFEAVLNTAESAAPTATAAT